ncbi:MAG TPA: glycosyltransferase family 4 protein, partial [Longimicrobiales bacterium]|nr:glycosyltransferase family 4 protein [Longimicrobiales bacterium]
GHDVRVFAHSGYHTGLSDRIIEHRLEDRVVPYPTTLKTLRRFIVPLVKAGLRQPVRAARWVRAGRQAGEPLKIAVMHAARLLLLPDEPPDLIVVHNLTPAVMYRLLPQRYHHTPLVLYYHGGEVSMQRPVARPARGFEAPHFVLAATRYVLEEAVSRGCDRARLRINPLGFDTDLFTPTLPKKYRSDGVLRFISIGRVHEEKGIRHAVEGVRLAVEQGLDRIHYTVVGAGPLVEPLRELARTYGIDDKVTFTGVLPREHVVRELERADVLLLPSVPIPTWQENQACVMQEAMLMHLLVASSRTGGVQESIPECMHTFSFDPADPRGIAASIARLYQLGTADFELLGQQARKFTETHYDIRVVTSEMLELGRSAVQSTGTRRP